MHHLTDEICTFKLDRHSRKQDHKRVVVCESLPRPDSRPALLDITLVVYVILCTVVKL